MLKYDLQVGVVEWAEAGEIDSSRTRFERSKDFGDAWCLCFELIRSKLEVLFSSVIRLSGVLRELWLRQAFEQFELSFIEEKYLEIELGIIALPIDFISCLNFGNLKKKFENFFARVLNRFNFRRSNQYLYLILIPYSIEHRITECTALGTYRRNNT